MASPKQGNGSSVGRKKPSLLPTSVFQSGQRGRSLIPLVVVKLTRSMRGSRYRRGRGDAELKTLSSGVILGLDKAVDIGTPVIKNLTQEAKEYNNKPSLA